MDHVPPLGMIAKTGLWLKDFAAMPERIRLLAEGLAADRDPRPICQSCGVGRVGQLTSIKGSSYRDYTVGTCGACATRFYVGDTGALEGLAPVQG